MSPREGRAFDVLKSTLGGVRYAHQGRPYIRVLLAKATTRQMRLRLTGKTSVSSADGVLVATSLMIIELFNEQ
jgi:hypothetical protein